MTLPNYRSHEPLYLVIIRDDRGEQLLKNWSQQEKAQVTIEGARMKIFDHRSLSLFNMTWKHGWERVMVWDVWNKRHVWFD
jgi:hypothetical protein